MTIRMVCFVLLNQIFLTQSELCPGENGEKCCIGFKWNDALRTCLPCDEGYHGTNCSTKCHFPWYGENCMSLCNCSKTDCNHVYGCVKSKEGGSLHLCSNIDGTFSCCQGYKLDRSQNTCIPCKNGFTGKNCFTKCQHPTYGQGCQSLCDCNATFCDHIIGCTQSSGNYQIQSTINMKYRNVTKELMVKDVVIDGESTSSVTINTTEYHTSSCYNKKTDSSRIHSLMFAVIGLTSVFVMIYIVYFYARMLEKRQTNTSMFTR